MKKFIFLCFIIPFFVFANSDKNDEIYMINFKKGFIGVYLEDEYGNQVYDENMQPKIQILFSGNIHTISSREEDKKSIEKQ